MLPTFHLTVAMCTRKNNYLILLLHYLHLPEEGAHLTNNNRLDCVAAVVLVGD